MPKCDFCSSPAIRWSYPALVSLYRTPTMGPSVNGRRAKPAMRSSKPGTHGDWRNDPAIRSRIRHRKKSNRKLSGYCTPGYGGAEPGKRRGYKNMAYQQNQRTNEPQQVREQVPDLKLTTEQLAELSAMTKRDGFLFFDEQEIAMILDLSPRCYHPTSSASSIGWLVLD